MLDLYFLKQGPETAERDGGVIGHLSRGYYWSCRWYYEMQRLHR